MPDDLMTVAQTAKHLGLSQMTVRRLIWKGLLPAIRVGFGQGRAQRLRVRPEDLERYLQQRVIKV